MPRPVRRRWQVPRVRQYGEPEDRVGTPEPQGSAARCVIQAGHESQTASDPELRRKPISARSKAATEASLQTVPRRSRKPALMRSNHDTIATPHTIQVQDASQMTDDRSTA